MRTVPGLLLVLSMAGPAIGATTCLSPPYTAAGTADEAVLKGTVETLRSALREFPSMLESFEAAAPELCLSTVLDGAQGYFNPIQNRIVLRRSIPEGLKLAIMIHELRHLEQFTRGYCPSNRLSMDENARSVMAMEADASAVGSLIAWRMKESGAPAAWLALLDWPNQADIAMRLGSELDEHGEVARAVSAAFDQWYASETRREEYYKAICSDYLDRLDASHELPGGAELPPDFIDRLCLLPDGAEYDCALPETARPD